MGAFVALSTPVGGRKRDFKRTVLQNDTKPYFSGDPGVHHTKRTHLTRPGPAQAGCDMPDAGREGPAQVVRLDTDGGTCGDAPGAQGLAVNSGRVPGGFENTRGSTTPQAA